MKEIKVAWITDRGLPSKWYQRYFFPLSDSGIMRYKNIAREMKSLSPLIRNELYRQGKRYDVLVVLKRISDDICRVVRDEKQKGTKIIFDANVNYYKVWGDFPVPHTRPTLEQQQNAVWLTQNSDNVVADSSYIASICREYNPNVFHIPDNVDPLAFNGLRKHRQADIATLVWSGISQKAFHLSLIEETLKELKDKIRLLLVSNNDRFPEVVTRLGAMFEVVYHKFSLKKYAALLLQGDILISPKVLNNSYEMGHSEYKITLGMAQGLPVLASPQQSYVEALQNSGAGIICKDSNEWRNGFLALINNAGMRQNMGVNGKEIVRARYSSKVVAGQYAELISQMVQ
ncbi:MAG: hypothetical protein A2293_06840 [Elusimicrobia bacterium RIFOXYB2_FULL_49_7]|nr:MAG: hypothetical protein A2293_06840 [Elusimicrobia bacterium RIFOXYB2_FULL_49_7]